MEWIKNSNFLLLLLFFFFLKTTLCSIHHAGIHVEKAALLAFKSSISDPQGALTSWRNSTHVCDFQGVVCNKWRRHVVQLRLNRTNLQGKLSPLLANLTSLQQLDLSENRLSGRIPPDYSSLRRLNGLRLSNNLLDGPIPESFSRLSGLGYLDIGSNRLTGGIPNSVFRNCSYLIVVDLSNNGFTGRIPPEFGNELPDLIYLNLYSNRLTGKLPLSLSNLSFLNLLDVENNQLSGELPSQTIGKLNYVEDLHLSDNYFISHDNNTNLTPFFISLLNCTTLTELELAGNGLGGRIPRLIGELTLELSTINLNDNIIQGFIPSRIGNLVNLTLLNLSNNLLEGKIPDEIGLLPRLEQLMLSNNSLSGVVPHSIGNLTSLGLLDLSNNNLSGELPTTLGNLSRLAYLFTQHNKFSGVIPRSLGECKDINKLDLSYNKLEGEIPKEISGIAKIFLNLSNNHLEGHLPLELSKMQQVQEIDLSANNLTGNIIPQLSSCSALERINLSHNSLKGSLPESFGGLRSLAVLDVSNNFLTGEIPSSLSNCSSLVLLNLSFNDLSGIIPSGGIFSSFNNLSFLGNPYLRSKSSLSKRKDWRHTRKFLIPVCIATSVGAFLTTIGCVMGIQKIRRTLTSHGHDTSRDQTMVLRTSYPRITYKELQTATSGFHEDRLIGTGSFGRVYKGIMPDGTIVAVKVLQLQTGNSSKSFNRECQVLKRIRHRNLMRIITACSLPDFKALVLPFMSNGSLESHLYMGSSNLSLAKRINICSDIAEGMAYLHHHSPVRVIHCDLKPSNVLLNDDFTALVSDFGISRLITSVDGGGSIGDDAGNSTANMLHGSVGYIAPEYGFGSITSTKGDVYSFGVLVLEIVTRKRPTDEMFEGGITLHRWVKNHYYRGFTTIFDPFLTSATREERPEVRKMWEIAFGELIEVGLLCTQESPSTRPTMLDVADDLDRLKRYVEGDSSVTFASSFGISSSNFGDD